MFCKGIYPYEYIPIGSLDGFEETYLPSTDSLQKLSGDISARKIMIMPQKLWKKISCKITADYHIHKDVLLLADVLSKKKKKKKRIHECIHYTTALHMAYIGILVYTNIKLELITDMHIFIEIVVV